MAHGPDYAQTANEQIVTLAMVETKQALDELDGIVTTSGADRSLYRTKRSQLVDGIHPEA